MNVTTDSVGAVNVARLSGDLDSTSAADLHEKIMPVLLDRRPLLLDVTDVTHISDAGLRTMLVIYRQAQAVDGEVAVVGLSEELRAALTATGYLEFFHVADDVAGGLRALRATDNEPIRSVLS
jgi:anti-sigma B factor antagonist